MTLIDSCALIDIEQENRWADWSYAALEQASEDGGLFITSVVLAEISAGPVLPDAIDRLMRLLDIRLETDLPKVVAHRAGRAHRLYRERGGTSRAILADFLIGAHAVTLGAALLTRDRARFASYFPELTLITPEGPHP